jgi:flagellar biogenesis protein FliO
VEGELILRFLGAFAVIGLLLYGFVAFAKHGGLGAGSLLRRSRLVEVIETTQLPHASSLHVVKVAEAYFVIGRTDGAIAMLGEIPKDAVERAEIGRRLPPAQGFLARLQARPPAASE